jgi:uncharacterized protein YneF (UPF0154 family)
MKIKRYAWYFVIGFVCLLLGIIVGMLYQARQPIEIDYKIRYSELLNWITTVIIGVLIGYFLRNQYENSKAIKAYILDDVKGILLDLYALGELFTILKNGGDINDDNRKDINSKMNGIDKKITVFCGLLEDSYKNTHKPIKDELVNKFNAYNKSITGDGLYNPNTAYFDDVVGESSKFVIYVRSLMFKVIKDL